MHDYKKITVVGCKDAIVRTKLYEKVCYFYVFVFIYFTLRQKQTSILTLLNTAM